MEVIALVSGGKDSSHAMLHCVARGHRVVALGNLFPRDTDELDSYMYQSVGHDLIDAYGECMGLPLYRRPITGTPKNTQLGYSPDSGDEVEDLYELLREIKEKHPGARGVSTGAIMSTYQKNRVENVCERLGLVSLAYLWEREQPALLQEMIDLGTEAIIIKVATLGLNRKQLGLSLREIQPLLLRNKDKFHMNVCGEGGEFESFTLDSPLFHKRIEL